MKAERMTLEEYDEAEADTPDERVSGESDSPTSAPDSAPDSAPWEDGFCAQLEEYSGPLELLRYLIHKNEIDILDIPIAAVLEQFLEHVHEARERGQLDLRTTGDYLVMSARLIEIKARMLSPQLLDEEDDLLEEELEDPRKNLVEQLLEYRDFKERALLLQEAHRRRSLGYERVQDGIPPPPPGTLDLSEASALDLSAAFQRVLDMLRERSAFSVIQGEEVPVEQSMGEILNTLKSRPGQSVPFEDLFPVERGMSGAISTFLALLELARLHQLNLVQVNSSDPLMVHLRSEE